MAATKAKIGYGALLKRGDGGSPEVFTTLLEVTKVGGPKYSRDAIDATHSESLDGHREFIAGLVNAGEISFEGNYVPRDSTQNQTTGILTEFANGDLRNWTLTLPPVASQPAAVWAISGILTAFEPDVPVDGKMVYTGTIKISGKPVLTVT